MVAPNVGDVLTVNTVDVRELISTACVPAAAVTTHMGWPPPHTDPKVTVTGPAVVRPETAPALSFPLRVPADVVGPVALLTWICPLCEIIMAVTYNPAWSITNVMLELFVPVLVATNRAPPAL